MPVLQSTPTANMAADRGRLTGIARSTKAGAAILCLAGLGQFGVLDVAQAQQAATPTTTASPAFTRVNGRLMLDYSPIRLTNGGSFDLLGLHYLQNVNDWLSVGVGAFAPIAQGNYGGFYGASATLHAQRQVYGNWFLDAGLSIGAGAGGSSVANIRTFSGKGLYGRAYAGFGYRFRDFSLGVNYSRVAILDSQINDSTISVFIQRPLSFSIGRYADAGTVVNSNDFQAPEHESILAFEASNVSQINPTGRYRGNIGFGSVQYSRFLDRNNYAFFGIDLGFAGLDWYNQAQGGLGRRFALGRNVNLYTQIGLGSGGWVTDTINTGPGFIVYPKATLEYLWGNGVGATASLGYLYAPMGTSRNWTVGLGLNYHLTYSDQQIAQAPSGLDYTLRGVRLNVFNRMTSPIFYNGRESAGINMIAVQADYALTDRWYVAGQIAAATTAFRGYAGYAEGFVGVGYTRALSRSGRLRGYAQMMYGLNDLGITAAHSVGPLLYPSFGLSYDLNDRLSIYGQMGAARSLGDLIGTTPNNMFRNYSIGLGVTYRFAMPTRS